MMTLRQAIASERSAYAKRKRKYLNTVRNWNHWKFEDPVGGARMWKIIQDEKRWGTNVSTWENSLRRTVRMYKRRLLQCPAGTKKALILFHGRRHFPLCFDLEKHGYVSIFVDMDPVNQPDMALDVRYELHWLSFMAPFDVCWCQGASLFDSNFLEELGSLLSPDCVFVLGRARLIFDWMSHRRYKENPRLLKLNQQKLAYFLGDRRIPTTIDQVHTWLQKDQSP